MYFGTEPYGLEGYIRHHGDGSNMYRTEEFAQPRTLQPGDVLANGLVVDTDVYDAGNGGVGFGVSGEGRRVVAGRIPLQLQSERPVTLPLDLQIGSILETGCVVLSEPRQIPDDDLEYEENRFEVLLRLTGGFEGHPVSVPKDLAIAVLPELYPPDPESVLGKFAIENVFKMNGGARRSLPKLKIFGLEL